MLIEKIVKFCKNDRSGLTGFSWNFAKNLDFNFCMKKTAKKIIY